MSVFARDRIVLVLACALGLTGCSFGGAGSGGGYGPTQPYPMINVVDAPAPAPAARPAAPVAEPTDEVPFPAPASEEMAEAPPAPAAPQPFTMERAGFAAPMPNGWRTRRKATALIYEGPMRLPSVAMWQPKTNSVEATVQGLQAELATPLKSVRITRPATETTLAGYRAFVAEGVGRAEGFPMRWRATIVDAKHPTIILGLAPTMFWGGNAPKIRNFERSIQPAPIQTASR